MYLSRTKDMDYVLELPENTERKNKFFTWFVEVFLSSQNFVHFLTSFLTALLHILLLSIFEPIFFFNYISKLEKQALLSRIDTYMAQISYMYSNELDKEQKLLFQNVIKKIQYTQTQDIQNNILKSILTKKAISYSYVIGGSLMVFFLVSMLVKKKIPWKFILIENLLMILLLVCYEYLFFSTIVIDYNPVSSSELNNYIMSLLMRELN